MEEDPLEGSGGVHHVDIIKEEDLGVLSIKNGTKISLPRRKYDNYRIYTKYFTKEYNSEHKLISVEPFFIDVRISPYLKGDVQEIKSYKISTGATVRILEDTKNIGYIYNIDIPEMAVDYYELKRIYDEIEQFKKEGYSKHELVKRWYEDFGILEHLLSDQNVQEININPPGYEVPLRIVHAEFGECTSNVYPSDDFLDYFVTRLRLKSGRPLNKASPQLDTEIQIGESKVRIATVIEPFSVFGSGFSIRKHRKKPWTLALFIKNKTINPWFAGIISLISTHGRSYLVAGPRGSGKTAMLSACLLEILPKYRMITIEDTQELPIEAYKNMGYDILPLKVRSALQKTGLEIPFDKGLRTSLRLGDSCLILGEIRSTEAKVLYEAMRVGAMANVVSGTIHADKPYGVYDRVVNDLGVTKGSFKVTDLIVIVNQIKDSTGMSRLRRVIQVTEVLKDWEDKPEFQDLLVYDPNKDDLVPTDFLLNGKSIILNTIMQKAKGYPDYKSILEDVYLRGWAKKKIIELARDDDHLEAPYIVKSNIAFTKLFEKHQPLKSKDNLEIFQREFINEATKIVSPEE